MRTEQEVLNDFEKLGYSITKTEDYLELINNNNDTIIYIDFEDKEYGKNNSRCYFRYFTIQEHKLLTDLFKIWGW